MESPVRTSFIPKQSIQPLATSRRSSSVSIFLLIGLFVFFVALVGSGGAFLWKTYLNKQLSQMVEDLEREKSALKADTLEEYSRLDTRLEVANSLLNAHQAPSYIFDFIEQNTIASVRFTSFTYTRSNDSKVEAGTMLLSLQGEAAGFGSVALQSDVFGKAKEISNPIFGGLNLDDVGRVTFDVKANINPKSILYTKKFDTVEGLDPLPEDPVSEPVDPLPSEENSAPAL